MRIGRRRTHGSTREIEIVLMLCILLIHNSCAADAQLLKVCYEPKLQNSFKPVTLPRAKSGLTLQLECKDSYEQGFTNITCQDGQWSEPDFSCRLVRCPKLENPPNGNVQSTCQERNCTAHFKCDDGFMYDGETPRLCQRNSTWSGENGICREVLCPELLEPDNGRIHPSNRSYLAVIEVECDEGYNYSEPQYTTRQCQGDGTWTGKDGRCELVHCPTVEEVDNGKIITKMDRITLHCDTGYTLSGARDISCLPSGKWSSELGSCVTGWSQIMMIVLVTLPIIAVFIITVIGVCVCYFLKKRRNQYSAVSQRHDVEIPMTCLDTTRLIIYVVEDFSDEYPDETSEHYRKFKAHMENGLRESDTLEELNIISISKAKQKVILEVPSPESMTSQSLIDVIGKTSFSTASGGLGRLYTINKEKIIVIDKVTDILKQTVLSDRHQVDRRDDKTVDFENQYVSLRLTCVNHMSNIPRDSLERTGHQKHTGEDTGSDDIKDEQVLDDADNGKLILVRGRAGVGKSTLMQRLASHWANGKWAERFKAIFLLNMRGFLNVQNKMELFYFLCFHSVYGIQDRRYFGLVSREWLERNAEYVCIILDGLDEIGKLSDHLRQMEKTSHKHTPIHWCFQLLCQKVLTDATIIACSRPLPDLRQIQPSKVVEVLGLHRKGVFDYINKNVQKKSQARVKQTITDNPILHSVCAITYYCHALCGVLEGDDVSETGLKNLSTYTQLMAYIIEKSMKRSWETEFSNKDIMYDEMSSSIVRLTNLAYHGIQSTGVPKLTFTEKDLQVAKLQEKHVQRMTKAGLLLQYETQGTISRPNPCIATEFAHLSIQEFFMMGGLLKEDPTKIKKYLDWMASSGEFNNALLFLCGLAFKNQSSDAIKRIADGMGLEGVQDRVQMLTIISGIVDQNNEAAIKDDLLVLQMIHESRCPDFAKTIGEKRFGENGMYLLGHQSLTLIDVRAITFLLTHSAATTKLSMKNVNLDLALIKELAEFLKDNVTLKNMSITDRNVDDAWMEVFMSGLEANKGLETIEVTCGRISDTGVGHLADALLTNRTLKEAWLKNLCLKDNGGEAILEALSENPTVSIRVASIECSDEDIRKQVKENDRIMIIL